MIIDGEVLLMDYQRIIKELREKLILSQQEFADLLGVSFASINRWENGKHEPTIKVKRKIVELCKENGIEVNKYRKNKNMKTKIAIFYFFKQNESLCNGKCQYTILRINKTNTISYFLNHRLLQLLFL